jgi:hypothetical protein
VMVLRAFIPTMTVFTGRKYTLSNLQYASVAGGVLLSRKALHQLVCVSSSFKHYW